MTLYCADILSSLGDIMICSLEYLVIILSESIASLIPTYSGGLTILLCSFLSDTCNHVFGTICGYKLPSTDTLRQSFSMGYCMTRGLCRIQLQSSYFTCLLVIVCPCLKKQNVPSLVALRFYMSAPYLRTAVFCSTSNTSENLHNDFLELGFSR